MWYTGLIWPHILLLPLFCRLYDTLDSFDPTFHFYLLLAVYMIRWTHLTPLMIFIFLLVVHMIRWTHLTPHFILPLVSSLYGTLDSFDPTYQFYPLWAVYMIRWTHLTPHFTFTPIEQSIWYAGLSWPHTWLLPLFSRLYDTLDSFDPTFHFYLLLAVYMICWTHLTPHITFTPC